MKSCRYPIEEGDSLQRHAHSHTNSSPISYIHPPYIITSTAPHHQTTLPNRRSKEPPRSGRIRVRYLDSRVQVIHVIVRDANPPPARHGRIGQIDREDDNDGTDSQSRIQTRRRDVVEAHPPSSVLVPDVFVEDIADDAPSEVVERSSRWDVSTAAEDKRSGEVAKGGAGEGASEGVEDYRCQNTSQPEVLEVGVDGARGEDALGTDETPDNGSVEKDATIGAVEFIDLVLGAHI